MNLWTPLRVGPFVLKLPALADLDTAAYNLSRIKGRSADR
jgi:hypothetical protein